MSGAGEASRRISAPRALDPATATRHAREAAILDVRDERAFHAGHWRGSGNLPSAEFDLRRSELPPRATPILVVAETGDAAARVAQRLAAMGFASVSWLDAPLAAIEGGLADRGPAARLWRPAPFLEEVLPLLPRGRAIDLAAGAGREAVFLAMNGFDVEAWDRDADALAFATGLAARHSVTIRTVACDLEAEPTPLASDAYALVTCFRFLHRPLFPAIARSLAPGGHLVYETYRVGQERFGKPRRPRFLLEPGELARAFPALEILRYEEPDPQGGPVAARLLARRSP